VVIGEPIVGEVVMHVVRIKEGHEHVDVEQCDPAHVLPVIPQVVHLPHRRLRCAGLTARQKRNPVPDLGRTRRFERFARQFRDHLSQGGALGGG